MEEKKVLSLRTFLDYVMYDICGCIKEECDVKIQGKSFVPTFVSRYASAKLNQTKCNYVNMTPSTILQGSSKKEIVQLIIALFLKIGLIRVNELGKENGRYFLLGTKKMLTWENIKGLLNMDIDNKIGEILKTQFVNKDLVLLAKTCLWYFRKAIVDTVVGEILERYPKVTGVSVGSTNIDSDYDITLYGPSDSTSKVIEKFNKRIQSIFGESSAKVFDTNVYGTSFIELDDNGTNVCSGKRFRYKESLSLDVVLEQHVWAYVKLYVKINGKSRNKKQFDALIAEIRDNVFAQKARAYIEKHDLDQRLYSKSLLSRPSFTGEISEDEIELNKTSFVNYYGSETYFTRGAFLDVVVNQQMCGKEDDKNGRVSLTEHDYVDSFVENMSELIGHYNKKKYTKRAMYALDKLTNVTKKKQIKSTLSNIIHLQSVCDRTILDCQEFLIMLECIRCINMVMENFEPRTLFKQLYYPGKHTLDNLTRIEESNDSLKRVESLN